MCQTKLTSKWATRPFFYSCLPYLKPAKDIMIWERTFGLQQGLEIRGFWFQKKKRAAQNRASWGLYLCTKWIFFSKNSVSARFLAKIRVSQGYCYVVSTVYSVKVHTSQLRLTTLLYKMPSNLKGKNFVSKFPGYCPQNTMVFFFHQN